MINFKTVRFQNFGSFGNAMTEIELDRHSMTLVSGCNGHGKSFALLDSITFGLFGKPFRKINIPQLVNSINNKHCLVEVEFEISNNRYKVIRGIKPKKFEIYKNGSLINQNATMKDYQHMLEDQILKMNYKSFTQVVILGSSAFVPFMQLSASDRRSVIEDILDINVFSTMNTLLKIKSVECKESQKEVVYKIDILKEKIDILETHIKNISKKSDENTSENQKEIQETKDKIQKHNNKIASMQENINHIQREIKSSGDVNQKMKKIDSLRNQLNNNRRKSEQGIIFFEANEVCPTCTQDIDDNNTNVIETIEKKKDKIVEIDEALKQLNDHYIEINEQLKFVNEKLDEISDIENDILTTNGWVTASNGYLSKLQNNTTQLQQDKENIKQQNEKLSGYTTKVDTLKEEKRELVNDVYYYDIAASLLKDSGIKSKIIKHYLPVMNKMINKYLADMDFFAQFMLDDEFNEIIKSRHRDDFSYMSFSEGEKMRIDLALLLSWREIARLKNSANTNLLILDEVFDSSLDAFGTDEFMKLLHGLSRRCNIFVISHKSDQLSDKIPNQMGFLKQNNFSKML